MSCNVYLFTPPATATAAVVEAEPIDEAVREVSARIAENNDERRLLFSRLDELRGASPCLRRRRARPSPPAMAQPVNFFSIEEADAAQAPAPLQVA